MKIIHDLTDNDYQNIHDSELTVYCHQNGNRIDALHYAGTQKKYVALKSVEIENSELSGRQWLDFINLNKPGLKCNLYHYSPEFTLIPDEFFDPVLLSNYFTLNFDRNPTDLILADYIETVNSHLVYSSNPADNAIISTIKAQQTRHISGLFIQALSGNLIPENSYFFTFISQPALFVFCIKNKEFILGNAFNFRHDEDILYHIANISKQLGYDMKKDTYYFVGNLRKTDSLYDLLYEYILDIRFAGLPDGIKQSTCFDSLNLSVFFHLFLPALCE